jgi:hypothetical protein
MAHDVFICHAHDDKPVADAACASLEARKIRCWIAPRDVSPGRDYAEAIVDAIGATQVVVLVFSEAANRSPHVKREIERAVSRGLPILPVRVDDAVPSASLEYFISGAHWLDAMTPPLEAHLARLADTVATLLGREAERAAAAPPVTPAQPPAAAMEPASSRTPNVALLVGGGIAVVLAIVIAALVLGGGGDSSSNTTALPTVAPTAAPTTTVTTSPADNDPFAEISGPDEIRLNERTFFDIADKRNVTRASWLAPWGESYADDGTGFWIEVEACADPCTLRLTVFNAGGESYETFKILTVIRD